MATEAASTTVPAAPAEPGSLQGTGEPGNPPKPGVPVPRPPPAFPRPRARSARHHRLPYRADPGRHGNRHPARRHPGPALDDAYPALVVMWLYCAPDFVT